MALETLLRFENCSSSHCLLSSWRRFHVFESSHPSFHRTVFFGAPLAFLRGVAMGLCPCYVIFMSSCGRAFLSLTALHTWTGTWYIGTYIVPTLLAQFIPSLFCLVPCCYVTLLPCYLVILLPCYPVTLLPCYPVTLKPCYPVTLLPCYPLQKCQFCLLFKSMFILCRKACFLTRTSPNTFSGCILHKTKR